MKEMTQEAKRRLAMKTLDALNAIGDKYDGDRYDLNKQIDLIDQVGDILANIANSSYKAGHDEGFKKGKAARFEFKNN